MNDGTKLAVAFLSGAALGAVGLALLNRGKLDFEYLKPICTNLLSKGMDLKDDLMRHVESMKEDWEDMAAEARDQADARKNPVEEVAEKKQA